MQDWFGKHYDLNSKVFCLTTKKIVPADTVIGTNKPIYAYPKPKEGSEVISDGKPFDLVSYLASGEAVLVSKDKTSVAIKSLSSLDWKTVFPPVIDAYLDSSMETVIDWKSFAEGWKAATETL